MSRGTRGVPGVWPLAAAAGRFIQQDYGVTVTGQKWAAGPPLTPVCLCILNIIYLVTLELHHTRFVVQ